MNHTAALGLRRYHSGTFRARAIHSTGTTTHAALSLAGTPSRRSRAIVCVSVPSFFSMMQVFQTLWRLLTQGPVSRMPMGCGAVSPSTAGAFRVTLRELLSYGTCAAAPSQHDECQIPQARPILRFFTHRRAPTARGEVYGAQPRAGRDALRGKPAVPWALSRGRRLRGGSPDVGSRSRPRVPY